jgi:hypothetical protein
VGVCGPAGWFAFRTLRALARHLRRERPVPHDVLSVSVFLRAITGGAVVAFIPGLIAALPVGACRDTWLAFGSDVLPLELRPGLVLWALATALLLPWARAGCRPHPAKLSRTWVAACAGVATFVGTCHALAIRL